MTIEMVKSEIQLGGIPKERIWKSRDVQAKTLILAEAGNVYLRRDTMNSAVTPLIKLTSKSLVNIIQHGLKLFGSSDASRPLLRHLQEKSHFNTWWGHLYFPPIRPNKYRMSKLSATQPGTLSGRLIALHLYFNAVIQTWIIQMKPERTLDCPPQNKKLPLLNDSLCFSSLCSSAGKAGSISAQFCNSTREHSTFPQRASVLILAPRLPLISVLPYCLRTAASPFMPYHFVFPSHPSIQSALSELLQRDNSLVFYIIIIAIIVILPPTPHSAPPPSPLFVSLWLCLSLPSGPWPVYPQQPPSADVWGVADHRDRL